MARLDYSGIQQDEQKQEIGNLPGQTGGTISSAVGGFSRPSTNQPGTGGAVAGGGPVSAPQGSKFTNIQQYLQANQGAGQAMAGQVGQTVDKSITRTGGNINKAKEELAKLNQAEQERLSGAERAGQVIQEDPTQIGGVTPAPSQERPVPAPFQGQPPVQWKPPVIPGDMTPSTDIYQVFGTYDIMPPANEVFTPEEISAFKDSGQAPPGYTFDFDGNLLNVEEYRSWAHSFARPTGNHGTAPQGTPVGRGEPEFTIDDIARFRAGLEGSDYDLINERLLEQVTGLNPELTRSINLAGDTATEQGRYNLLRESLGRPGYTSGEQRLDQLLVQSEGQGVLRELQKQAAERASGLASQYDQYRDEATTNQEALREAVMAAQGTINRAIGNWSAEDQEGALGRLYNDLQERAQNLPAELQDQYRSDIEQWISDPNSLTEEQLERLGLYDGSLVYAGGPPEGLSSNVSRYGLDFYLAEDGSIRRRTPGNDPDEDLLFTARPDLSGFTTDALMGNVATEQDRARLNALRQIADLTDTEAYLGEGVELPGYGLNQEAVEHATQQQRGRVLKSMEGAIAQGGWKNQNVKQAAEHFKNSPQDQVDFLNSASKGAANSLDFKYRINPQTGKIQVLSTHPSAVGSNQWWDLDDPWLVGWLAKADVGAVHGGHVAWGAMAYRDLFNN